MSRRPLNGGSRRRAPVTGGIYCEDRADWTPTGYYALWRYVDRLAEYVDPTPAQLRHPEHRSAGVQARRPMSATRSSPRSTWAGRRSRVRRCLGPCWPLSGARSSRWRISRASDRWRASGRCLRSGVRSVSACCAGPAASRPLMRCATMKRPDPMNGAIMARADFDWTADPECGLGHSEACVQPQHDLQPHQEGDAHVRAYRRGRT